MMPANANGALGMVTRPRVVAGDRRRIGAGYLQQAGTERQAHGPLSWSSALLPNSDGRPIGRVGGIATTQPDWACRVHTGMFVKSPPVVLPGAVIITADQDGADQLLAQRRIPDRSVHGSACNIIVPAVADEDDAAAVIVVAQVLFHARSIVAVAGLARSRCHPCRHRRGRQAEQRHLPVYRLRTRGIGC